ncbi:MAG: hypothetical protein Q4P78_00380 [Rothia sp. (in: high G+C Gram-positive bacteria)]|uniref:hypothetical protein n=1 Tax=Rothia sp. (in: high G+C Gram-positive bacteria) TaxID=1885016 RepID=UPI0026DEFA86|nr:hypothetical protein [Rothia sp. (in: high G+C Gram-positive bacteria)]MDO5749645.1 hypothetical protein [Rothia sp. (in: high G+C Gram-positive bacteria)]
MANPTYDAAARAIDEILHETFIRDGAPAKARFHDAKTASIAGELEWVDTNFLNIHKKIAHLKAQTERNQRALTDRLSWLKSRADINWGGIFEMYSYSGRTEDLKPGVLPLLKKLKAQKSH